MPLAFFYDFKMSSEFEYYKDICKSKDKISFELIFVPWTTHFLLTKLNNFLVKKKKRELATLKDTGRSDYKFLIKCPYCQSVFFQKELTKKYKCPQCDRKSQIVPFDGTFADLFWKRINKPTTDNKSLLTANSQ